MIAHVSTPAQRLRQEFDETFARPLQLANTTARDFILIRAGGKPFALSTAALNGIQHKTTLVAVPSSSAALIGLAGVRGVATAVFSIGALLGLAEPLSEAWGNSPLFALSTLEGQPIGLAFERLERFLRVDLTQLLPAAGSSALSLMHEEVLYTVIEPQTLLHRIANSQEPTL